MLLLLYYYSHTAAHSAAWGRGQNDRLPSGSQTNREHSEGYVNSGRGDAGCQSFHLNLGLFGWPSNCGIRSNSSRPAWRHEKVDSCIQASDWNEERGESPAKTLTHADWLKAAAPEGRDWKKELT